jgi:hypothetical protein
MTAEIAAWGVLCVAGVGAVITGLIIAGRWALGREKERTAAATFEADFIPECADVARTDADLPKMGKVIVEVVSDTSGFVAAVKRTQAVIARKQARRQADADAAAELDLVIEELGEALGGLRA